MLGYCALGAQIAPRRVSGCARGPLDQPRTSAAVRHDAAHRWMGADLLSVRGRCLASATVGLCWERIEWALGMLLECVATLMKDLPLVECAALHRTRDGDEWLAHEQVVPGWSRKA